jgi:hypothetical protein
MPGEQLYRATSSFEICFLALERSVPSTPHRGMSMTEFTAPVVPPKDLAGVWKNTWFGCLAGLIGGSLLTFIIGAWDMLRGRFIHYNVPFSVVAIIYVFGGAAAGAISGFLSPLARWYVGTLLVGAIAVSPIYFAIACTMTGPPSRWDNGHWFSAFAAPLLVGAIAGHKWWVSHDHPQPKRNSSGDLPSPRRKFRPWKS